MSTFIMAAISAATLAGCATEYHGADSGIDGVLWRQVASQEDPLIHEVYQLASQEQAEQFMSTGRPIWDRTLDAIPGLDLDDGGVVLYDSSSTSSGVSFSAFISSGPRADAPTDEGGRYSGPSVVFTCYRFDTEFLSAASVSKTNFSECPPELREALPADAAFASGEVFDG